MSHYHNNLANNSAYVSSLCSLTLSTHLPSARVTWHHRESGKWSFSLTV